MKGIISDPTTAVDPSTYDTVLDFVARHCIGVLYDETVKSFCILGDDQAKLVNRKEQQLTKPTIVYGLAGTGKTISIMARIQGISGNLNASCKEEGKGGDVIHEEDGAGGGETQDIDTLLEDAERVGHSEEVLKILRQTKADQDRGIYKGGTIYGGN